jgi:hypothetical protein
MIDRRSMTGDERSVGSNRAGNTRPWFKPFLASQDNTVGSILVMDD